MPHPDSIYPLNNFLLYRYANNKNNKQTKGQATCQRTVIMQYLFPVSYSPWLGSSPFWEVSLILAPLALHWLRNESVSSVFCYIQIIIFSRLDICDITIVVLSHIQLIFFSSFSKNSDLWYALDNERWVYYLYFLKWNVWFPFFFANFATLLWLFKKILILCLVYTLKWLDLNHWKAVPKQTSLIFLPHRVTY